jgi:hypothetical protein
MPWLTPQEIPEDTVCRVLFIPDDAGILGDITGAILPLIKPYNWQAFGAVTPDEMAQRMSVMFYDFLQSTGDCSAGCELPEGGQIARLSELGTWEVLDGAWVEPSGDLALPPYVARTEPSSYERKCLAAKNAAAVLAQVYEEMTDIASAHLTLAESIAGLAGGIGLLILTPIGGLALLGMTLVITAAEFAFAIAEVITMDVWGEDFTHDLTCTLFENAIDTGGVITFDFQGVQNGLLLQTDWLDATFFAQQLAAQVRFILSTIGAEGLNFAGEQTEETVADCDCCPAIDVASPWANIDSSPNGFDDCSISAPNCVWRGAYIGYVDPIGYTTQFDIIIDLGEVRAVTSVDYAGAFTGIANAFSIMSDDGTTLLAQSNPAAGYETGGTVELASPHSTQFLWLRGQATDEAPSERHLWLLVAAIHYEC